MFICNQCESHGCTAKPETPNKCSGYIRPEWIIPNRLGEELLHKSAESAEKTLTLLHNHGISWKRYVK